ncbi:MAG TPA: hypothetical protein VF559_10570 [Caulobacteraceae bacterium]|jgi:hypothetical protein
MDRLAHVRLGHNRPPLGFRGLAWLGGVAATAAAALVAAVIAVVFAATMTVIALMTGALIALGSLAYRARRAVRRAPADAEVIEARHLGGHSWVAYGWDRAR